MQEHRENARDWWGRPDAKVTRFSIGEFRWSSTHFASSIPISICLS
jgi:hypothetical protein